MATQFLVALILNVSELPASPDANITTTLASPTCAVSTTRMAKTFDTLKCIKAYLVLLAFDRFLSVAFLLKIPCPRPSRRLGASWARDGANWRSRCALVTSGVSRSEWLVEGRAWSNDRVVGPQIQNGTSTRDINQRQKEPWVKAGRCG